MAATTDSIPEIAHLTADAVVFGERDGRLHALVIRRCWDPYAGQWALPGGHVDVGEDVEAAARRELAEETGLIVSALKLVGVYADPGRDPRGRYVTWAYMARVADPPRPTAGDDAAEARWMPVDELLKRPMAFDHEQIIHDALRLLI